MKKSQYLEEVIEAVKISTETPDGIRTAFSTRLFERPFAYASGAVVFVLRNRKFRQDIEDDLPFRNPDKLSGVTAW